MQEEGQGVDCGVECRGWERGRGQGVDCGVEDGGWEWGKRGME